MDGKKLEEFLGPVGIREYRNAKEWDKPKIEKWCDELAAADTREFILMVSSAILDDALMGNMRDYNSGYGARTTAGFQEAKRRHMANGHDKRCRGATLYTKAHDNAMRSQGHTPRQHIDCSCEKGEK